MWLEGHLSGMRLWRKFLFLLFFVVLGLVTLAPKVRAEHCGVQHTASGYFFDDYESVEYVDNLLVLHFKLKEPYNDGRGWKTNLDFLSDECGNGPNQFLERSVSITPGVQFFSIRFISPTRFEIWNDGANTPEICADCVQDIPTTPGYYEIIFRGRIDGSASTLQSSSHRISATASDPPVRTETLPAPPNCSPFLAGGYFFDNYERAEYVNGLLAYHFRLKTPYNDGRSWRLSTSLHDQNCNQAESFATGASPINNIQLPIFMRYYSVRFASPGHYDIWNDETNQIEICPTCSVNIPGTLSNGEPYSFISFAGLIDGGASGFNSTPFPIQDETTVPAREPVIIIPGIAGSELYNGDDLIWPDITQMLTDLNDQFLTENLGLDIDGNSIIPIVVGDVIERIPPIPVLDVNIFQNLRISLETSGYSLSNNLFFFPYDWRLNLDITKDILKQKIDQVKAQTGSEKVNIIAHSMGGLLAKDYINQYGKGDIDKLIFVGTPHLGAPKAAKVLLEGDRLGIPVLEEDRIKEIAKNSPAIYELLPNQTYFANLSGYIRPFSFFSNPQSYDYTQTKDFLLGKTLNANVFGQAESFFTKNLQETDFFGIDTYNIAGCKSNTAVLYQLGIFNTISGIGYSSGDETVPLGSADYINIPASQKFYVKKAKHSELPSTEGVKNAIVQILSSGQIQTTNLFTQDSSGCNIKGKVLLWRSPVDVHIYDSQNNHAGPSENNTIEYSVPGIGYEIIGHEKFIFLPTDDGQEYRVEARGTDNGTFDLLVSENDNGNTTSTQVFNNIPVSTTTDIQFAISATISNDTITITENGGEPEIVQANATLTGDQGEDVVPPELMAGFDIQSGDFVFEAIDNSDPNPFLECGANRCLINDRAGNTTELQFAKQKKRDTYALNLRSTAYNGDALNFDENALVVKLDQRQNELRSFVQTFLLNGQETVKISYNKRRDESTVYTLGDNNKFSKQILPGIKILQLITDRGKIETSVK